MASLRQIEANRHNAPHAGAAAVLVDELHPGLPLSGRACLFAAWPSSGLFQFCLSVPTLHPFPGSTAALSPSPSMSHLCGKV